MKLKARTYLLFILGGASFAPSLCLADACSDPCPTGQVLDSRVQGDPSSNGGTTVCTCVPESTGMVSNADLGVDESSTGNNPLPYEVPDIGAAANSDGAGGTAASGAPDGGAASS